MKKMSAKEIKKSYIDFFVSKDHKEIKGVSLVPENDASVLFTTAGMHPLVPFLLGEEHPSGKRLVDVQNCLRTGDIDAVGDDSHLTFFEMLGNWSLGDYFKEESIEYSFDYLTKILEIPIEKIAVSVFLGDSDAPKDTISANKWESLGIKKENIFYLPKDNNWWWAGDTGPCGPDTEIFYIKDQDKCSEDCSPACDCGKYMEIWNNVFMEYNKTEEGKIVPLKQKNVDTGMGFERILSVIEEKESVYDTEILLPIINIIKKYEEIENIASERIITDHLRASIMIINDGIKPSNVDQGYVLRRLIRRSIRHMKTLEIDIFKMEYIIKDILGILKDQFNELNNKEDYIIKIITEETNKFMKTLVKGEKKLLEEIDKTQDSLDGQTVFHLYDTYGFPPELTQEIANENNLDIDMEGFNTLFKEHQDKSRMGSEQKFKGGLKSTGEIEVKYHTATHLLNAALKQVLGDHIHQMGSNITPERLRFDFSHFEKVSSEDLEKVENIINEQIKKELSVISEVLSNEDAIETGAEAMFIDKYGDMVTVYSIGDFSKEICGGPHVINTKELGTFKIVKEEASSSGVRRIKAILE